VTGPAINSAESGDDLMPVFALYKYLNEGGQLPTYKLSEYVIS